jgi:hypothetical protein
VPKTLKITKSKGKSGGSKPINIDENLRDADWIKTMSWDIPDVQTDEDLKKYLRSRGMTMEEFKKLPAYEGWMKRNQKRSHPKPGSREKK